MSWRSRALLGGVWVAVWVAVWCGLVSSRADWWRSFAQSANAVSSAVVIVWPVAVGLGAAQAVRLRRTGVLERVAAWPGEPLAGLLPCFLTSVYPLTVAGGALALMLAGCGAAWAGSDVTLVRLREFIIAVLGIGACLAWAWALALLIPSFAIAALAPMVVYAMLWLLPARAGIDPVVFAGNTMMIGSAMAFWWKALAMLVGWQVSSLCAASAWMVALAGRHRLAGWLAAVPLSLVSAGLLLFGPATSTMLAWGERGSEAWRCREVGPCLSSCWCKWSVFWVV